MDEVIGYSYTGVGNGVVVVIFGSDVGLSIGIIFYWVG